MKKSILKKIGIILVIIVLLIVIGIFVIYYIDENTDIEIDIDEVVETQYFKAMNENVVVDGEGVLYLTEKGNLYHKTELNEYTMINEYFGNLKVKQLYCTLFGDYAYVVLENDDLYYLEKEYYDVNYEQPILVEELNEEKIKNILIESGRYILTESGKVYRHVEDGFIYVEELSGYIIESIEGDSDMMFAFTDSNKLLYWSNNVSRDKITKEYNYSIHVIEAEQYISSAEVLDIMYINGISALVADKGYFINTTDGIYKINGIEENQWFATTYEYDKLGDDNIYIANELVKTDYTYSENKKVKVKLKYTFTGHMEKEDIVEVNEEEVVLGEFEEYVVQIEDDGILLLDGTKVLYGDIYTVPLLTEDAGTSTDYVFEKL